MDWQMDEVLVCPQNSMKTKRHFEPHPRWQMSDYTICQNQLQQSKQLTSNHQLAGSLSPPQEQHLMMKPGDYNLHNYSNVLAFPAEFPAEEANQRRNQRLT